MKIAIVCLAVSLASCSTTKESIPWILYKDHPAMYEQWNDLNSPAMTAAICNAGAKTRSCK